MKFDFSRNFSFKQLFPRNVPFTNDSTCKKTT